MPVSLTVYDGANTIGGNKILLEDRTTGVFLDFGTSFSTRFQYFEEFLVPRSRAGLLDLIHMGLLPPLRGIYRSDLEDSDGRAWERAQRYLHYRSCRVNAVLLSHAHMDHCGYISFLDTKIPVVSTCMTAYLAKAIQDCGAHQFEGEMCYTVPKVVGEEGAIGAGKHKDFPFERRAYLIADRVCQDPGDFWNLSPASPRGRYFPPLKLEPTDQLGGLQVRFLPVDHSIYGSAAIAMKTSEGWVVYTGDLRRHGGRRAFTEDFVREAAALKPVALLCEGTNVEKEPGVTEEQVYDACLAAVQEVPGQFVVADFGPRNVERLLTFLEIARRTGRRLAVTDKDAYLLTAMHAVDPSIPTPGKDTHLTVYRRVLLKPQQWVDRVRDWYPQQVSAADVHAHPGEYVCCFSFFDIGELVDIDPSGGRWIYSASEAHNEEQQFELWRLHNWLDRFNLTPIGLTQTASPYHASGHISGRELRDIILQIRPQRVIPVHTSTPKRFAEMLHGDIDVRVPDTGISITLA
jgi:ribonuclease J